MTYKFTIQAPCGLTEIVGPKGEVLAAPDPWTGTEEEASAELERRSRFWSARGDCFVRDARTTVMN